MDHLQAHEYILEIDNFMSQGFNWKTTLFIFDVHV